MKIVIDTNVFISALLTKRGNYARKIIELALLGQIQPVMGEALFNEYFDVMNRQDILLRCPLDADERIEFLAAFLSCCEWRKIYYVWRPNLRDEGDNHVIELAIAGGANYIITNNIKDLTSGELQFDQLRILTPQDFIEEQLWA